MGLSFEESVRRVSSLESKGWRLGLDRMAKFVELASIEHWPKFIHIAGTNGKGSVTAYVQNILWAHGYKTGGYFSPYVYSVRERIQFADPATGPNPDWLVSEGDFASLVERLWPIAESMETTEFGGPTEFEFKTTMGFLHWSDKRADYVALEVGLGGRLDATNVVVPASSVIASVGLDHQEILGNTLAQIAIEKAGVIKPGLPVVLGHMPEEAGLAIETVAKVNKSPVWELGRDVVLSAALDGYRVTCPGREYAGLTPGISGVRQAENMAVAVAACEAAGALSSSKGVARGVAMARLPGRMQRIEFQGKSLLLDGAHNLDAADALIESLSPGPDQVRQTILLTSMLHGHEAEPFYEKLAKVARRAVFVPVDFHRSREPSALEAEVGWLFAESSHYSSATEGLRACMASDATHVIVTGSFYLVGEVGRMVGADGSTSGRRSQ